MPYNRTTHMNAVESGSVEGHMQRGKPMIFVSRRTSTETIATTTSGNRRNGCDDYLH